MKKVVSILAVILVTALASFAADRENMSINELKVGKILALADGMEGASLVSTPSQSFTFMDDFMSFSYTTNYDVPSVSYVYVGDAAASAGCVVGAAAGGILTLTTGATSNNEAYVQMGPVGGEASFSITSNGEKRVTFEARVAGSKAGINAATFVGLASAGSCAANFLTDSTGVIADRDYVGFQLLPGTVASWNFTYRKNGATAVTVSAVASNSGPATFSRLGFKYDGLRTLRIMVDGVETGSPITVNAATFPNAVVMSPILACKTITASYTPTNKIDYVYVNQER